MLLSLIIPCYHDAAALRSCLASYWSCQQMQKCELVVVDDTGGDEELDRLVPDSCANANLPIRLIRQQHAGASAARNKGLTEATGEFVWFVDADDELSPHTFACLIPWLESFTNDIDIVKMGPLVLNQERWPEPHPNESVVTSVISIAQFSLGALDHTTYIFRRSFLQNHHLRYPEDHTILEDSTFILQVLQQTPTVAFNPSFRFYYYKDHSSTRGPWSKSEQQERWADIEAFFDCFHSAAQSHSWLTPLYDHYFYLHLRILTVKGYPWKQLLAFRQQAASASSFYYGHRSLPMRLLQSVPLHFVFYLLCQVWTRTPIHRLRRY